MWIKRVAVAAASRQGSHLVVSRWCRADKVTKKLIIITATDFADVSWSQSARDTLMNAGTTYVASVGSEVGLPVD